MFSTIIKAVNTEVAIFTSGEYDSDVEAFQDDINSWFKSQPDNVAVADIIYRHSGVTSRGKDIFSLAIVSRTIAKTDENL